MPVKSLSPSKEFSKPKRIIKYKRLLNLEGARIDPYTTFISPWQLVSIRRDS